MDAQYGPDVPEEETGWTGRADSEETTPAHGDAADTLSRSGWGPTHAPGAEPVSPYDRFAPGAQSADTGSPAPGAPTTRRTTTRWWGSRNAASTRTSPDSSGGARGLRRISARQVGGILVGIVVVLVLATARACSSGGEDSGRATDPAPRARNSIAPSPVPSLSALRALPGADTPAPEVLSSTPLPAGTGYSPDSAAPAGSVSLRLHDTRVGEFLVVTVGGLREDPSQVPAWRSDQYYADETILAVRVHVEPHGYASDDYPMQPGIRLRGESGRWYDADTFGHPDDEVAPHDVVFVFGVPGWDLPQAPVAEVRGDVYATTAFPVCVDLG